MSRLIILDRDGVLNGMVVDAEHGTIDSPLHPLDVYLLDCVPEAVKQLNAAGYKLAIATNQPAGAKGKTTRSNLEAVHAEVLDRIAANGGSIASTHICWHTREDKCVCRKPQPGLLRAALAQHSDCDPSLSWMVGDGVTDIQAGAAIGLRTAFLGSRNCSACKVLNDRSIVPHYWGDSLLDFAKALLRGDI